MNHVKRWVFVLSALGALSLVLPISAPAQDADGDDKDFDHPSVRCMTKHPGRKLMEDLEKSHKLWKAERAAGKGGAPDKGKPPGGGGTPPPPPPSDPPTDTDTIPVYFHVIRKGLGIVNGDLQDSAIQAQIAVLNKAYASRSRFKFQLVATDRTTDRLWFTMSPGGGAEKSAKTALRKGGPKSLNIYSCSPGQNLLGWATFPWSYGADPLMDGVVIHYNSMPGGAFVDYNEGDTATHEVGHWLGLYHTFQGGCSPDLINGGDMVEDTAPEKAPYYGDGSDAPDTCAGDGPDPIHNYMDYSVDSCLTEFSPKQGTRMSEMWDHWRLQLP